MKVLFLDIDGVLNSLRTAVALQQGGRRPKNLDPVAVRLVDWVCREAGAKVVIISAWRLNHSVDQLNRLFRRHGANDIEVVGLTGYSGHGRGAEISDWLAANPQVKRYVVVDDLRFDIDAKHPLVHVEGPNGLLLDHAVALLAHLHPEHPHLPVLQRALAKDAA